MIDPRILIGNATNDDAAVIRLSDDLALVSTVDFFTPIVDDPFQFGAIAAANALSDIYAMGAEPLFALALLGFPRARLGSGEVERILQGGQAKVTEAGIAVAGGHTIDDAEPKYGLAVTGTVHPERIVRNVGARIGDHLFLTKPLGSGILATAIKRDLASASEVASAIDTMAMLNRGAARAMVSVGVHAATDVTGFGLLGHLREMLGTAPIGVRLSAARIPYLPGVAAHAANGTIPGGTQRNLDNNQDITRYAAGISPSERLMIADAQTSGGLLISVPSERANDLADALRREGVPVFADIGVITDTAGCIEIDA
jgi:selenide,water dikinase